MTERFIFLQDPPKIEAPTFTSCVYTAIKIVTFTFIKLFNRLGIRVTGGSNITREDICQGPAEEERLLLLQNTVCVTEFLNRLKERFRLSYSVL